MVQVVAVVVPPLVKQTNSFVRTIPATVRSASDTNSSLSHLVDRYHLQPQVDNLSTEIGDKVGNAPAIVITTAGRIGTVLISIITMIVLTFMMLVEGPAWMRRALQLVPPEKHKPYHQLAMQMYKVVTGYVNGQVLIAAIASVFAFVALMIASTITHTTINAAALAGIVFLFGLIPLIGNTLAAVLVCIICLFSSTALALIMLVYFPIYQQIENATLQPHIQAKNNQLTPLIVFMAALVGAGFAGLLGALIAIPVAGCLRILFMYKYGDKFAPNQDSVNAN